MTRGNIRDLYELIKNHIISTKSLPPFERASKTHSAAQPTDLNKRIIQTTANTTPNTAPRKRPKKLPKIDKINGVPIPPIIASIPKTTGSTASTAFVVRFSDFVIKGATLLYVIGSLSAPSK
ncbi:19448_t:CDS:2 [Entrophospora sp. SA101]|nr:19448_t:CDS:2 [Entrophospora sp. SA101]